MATKFKLETTNTGRNAVNNSIEFISWSPYPQPKNKKTELVNRLGSTETIVQSLYDSSMPSSGTAVLFLHNSNITAIREKQAIINAMVGIDCKLSDNLNTTTYEKLVITDLVTTIKAVNKDSWMLICNFTQTIRA